MTLNPSGYGGLLNPYQQLEKYGYHLVSINPEMKVADMSHVLRQVVLDYLDALAHMNSERHAEQARAYFHWRLPRLTEEAFNLLRGSGELYEPLQD